MMLRIQALARPLKTLKVSLRFLPANCCIKHKMAFDIHCFQTGSQFGTGFSTF